MEEINSTVTRRIRIWEGEKCIMAIDLQGDTIVTRPKKKNLKVSYEAFQYAIYFLNHLIKEEYES